MDHVKTMKIRFQNFVELEMNQVGFDLICPNKLIETTSGLVQKLCILYILILIENEKQGLPSLTAKNNLKSFT